MLEFRMDELKSTVKILVIAGVILFVSQFKIKDVTLENRTSELLVQSSMAHTLRDTAHGGALFLKHQFENARSFFQKKMAQDSGGNHLKPNQNTN